MKNILIPRRIWSVTFSTSWTGIVATKMNQNYKSRAALRLLIPSCSHYPHRQQIMEHFNALENVVLGSPVENAIVY